MGLSDGIFGKLQQATRGLQATGKQIDWLVQGVVGTDADVIKTENSIGVEVAADFFQTFAELKDEGYITYMSEIHNWLVENGAYKLDARFANPERQWHRHVVADNLLFAACLPGGYIIMSRDLIDVTKQDQNEVAFILAHETSHILLSHARKRAQKEFMVRMGTRVLPVASAGAAVFKTVAGGIARGLVENAYSQQSELEADTLAVEMLHKAGFDARGGIRHLERVREVIGKLKDIPAYYAQHPPIATRIQNMEQVLTT
jgi:predicted Zn-dependent protease